MRFDLIRAQEGPVSVLKRALERDRVPTGYLFTGPPGCGRMSAALAMAASLNCTTAATACGSCSSCLLYQAGSHPDLRVIRPPEGKRQIVIEQIREQVLERAWLKPMSGATSTFIIDDAHLMNVSASNAFLKTLEEPPATSHFILIAPDRDSVLPTVSSRCQTLGFQPLPRQVLQEILVEHGIESTQAAVLASMARGSARRALDYHSGGALDELAREFEPLSSIQDYGDGQLLDLAQKWGRNREGALGVLEFMAQWYRDMMILSEGAPEGQVTHLPHIGELRRGAGRVDARSLAAVLESVEDAREALEANANVQLALDALLFRIRNHTLAKETGA